MFCLPKYSRGRTVGFSTLYSLAETLHPTSREWLLQRLKHADFDSTLLISLYFNLSSLYFVNLGLASCHFPWWIAIPGGALSPAESLFSLAVISPSYPILPRLPCRVLTELLCLRATSVYPSLPLQKVPPIHTGSTPTTPCNTPLHTLGLLLPLLQGLGIISLSWISGHGAGSLTSHWGSTIKSL